MAKRMKTIYLAMAIATAKAASSQTSQSALNNANTALTNAIAAFKAKAIDPVDKSNLENLISLTENVLTTTTAGTAIGQYSASLRTDLETALTQAVTINNNASATQTEVDNQVSILRTVYDAYMASEVQTTVDKSNLESLISVTANILTTTMAGTAIGQYSASLRTDLESALAQAVTINKNASATQTEVDNQVSILRTVYDAYMASEVQTTVDKSNLESLISVTANILTTTMAGTAIGQYSASLRTDLESALAQAVTINKNASATQTEVDNQVSILRTVYNAYMASEVKTAVDDLEFVFSVYPNPCVDVLNIEANNEIAFVKILGLNGSKSTIEVNQTTAQISVTSLTNGIYVMQVVFADGSVKTTRVIKK